jgi:hypothetical protein
MLMTLIVKKMQSFCNKYKAASWTKHGILKIGWYLFEMSLVLISMVVLKLQVWITISSLSHEGKLFKSSLLYYALQIKC